jgi:hypothetical protein
MGQKFFISFNSADRTKAHWIAWTLKEAGHEVAVHDWEIPAGANPPLWMSTKLAWADRLIAVISPDYIPTRYSPSEWASQVWNDPDGTKGSVIPVIVRPTSNIPPLLLGLNRIDLTSCSEDEARRRLIKGVDMPAPPERQHNEEGWSQGRYGVYHDLDAWRRYGLLLQRFGKSARARLHFVEQPHVLDGDHRLVGEGGYEFDLPTRRSPCSA